MEALKSKLFGLQNKYSAVIILGQGFQKLNTTMYNDGQS